MAQRAITQEEVDEVLAAPDVTYRSRTHADRLVVLGTTTGRRRLKVVVLARDRASVVTVADRDDEE